MTSPRSTGVSRSVVSTSAVNQRAWGQSPPSCLRTPAATSSTWFNLRPLTDPRSHRKLLGGHVALPFPLALSMVEASAVERTRGGPIHYANCPAPIAEKSADRFFATEVDGHEDLHSDSPTSTAELIDAHNLSQGFTIDGAGAIRIRAGNKDAHSLFVSQVIGDEIDAVQRRVNGWQDLIKIEAAGIRGSDAHRLWEPQTRFATTLLSRRASHSQRKA